MVQATQGGTVGNLKAGPCSIVFKGATLGFTQDGQEVSTEPTWADIRVDQFGETPLDALLAAQEVTVTVRLSEFTMDNLQKVLGGAIKVTDAAKEKVTIGRSAGYRARSDAGVLVLHPITNAVADVTADVTIHKAYVNEAVAFSFVHNDIRSYEVVFRALIDETKTEGNHLMTIGDTSAAADTTPPSIASIVPADGAAAIAVSDNIVITLAADDLDESTMTSDNIVAVDTVSDTTLLGTLTWASGAKTITFNPTTNMDAATKHRVVVGTGLKDINGNALALTFSSDFTTA